MLETAEVFKRIEAMRLRARERDERQRQILAIRANDYEAIAPGLLPEDFKQPLVANLIDTAAHDLAEVMAPLPTISCASSSQITQSKKDFANKRALIANSYVQQSRLSDQMYDGADRYMSFGYMAYIVEPDFIDKIPFIRISDTQSSYWVNDYKERVAQYVEIMRVPGMELCEMYPDHAAAIHRYLEYRTDNDVEVGLWVDRDGMRVLCTDMNLEFFSAPNVLDRPAVRILRRPNLEKDGVKGQFNDVIWVQYARALTAAFTMSAVQQAVEAPLAMPDDVQSLEMGPFAVIQSKEPQKIGRVPLNVPQSLFPEMSALAQEQRIGSRYPEGRSGSMNASVITGQGVQALMGTFDTQVQTFQRLNETALADVLSMCFEMDEKLWPNLERSVRVKDQGSPVEIKYTPAKDIKQDYSVDVAYGAVAGLDPNRSLIFLLQAVSGGFMSRETGRKHMPIELDHVAETKRMDTEAIRESMLGSVAALSQAIPAMAQAGQDPRVVVEQLAQVIALREKGKTIEEAVTAVFAPKQPAQDPSQQAPNPQQSAMDALAQAQGGAPGGAPPGGPPGPPSAAPGPGAPQSPGQNLLMGLAGLTPSGSPNLQSNVSSRAPAH